MNNHKMLAGIIMVTVVMFPYAGAFSKDAAKGERNILTDIQSQEELDDWMTYYYKSPQPELALPALKFISEEDMLEKICTTDDG